MIMHNLNNAPLKSMRRIDLAECVGITASGVTRLLAPMEKIGVLQKEQNPRDARVSLVKLSTAGETLYQDASISFDSFAQSKLAALSKKQLETLIEFSNKLL
jgi:DNA-binding MarR family transcriptional regulator